MQRDMRPVRQGDVLLLPIDAIPPTAKPVEAQKRQPPILAYGETTGHAHALYGRARMFRADDTGGGGATVAGKPVAKVLAPWATESAVLVEAEPGTVLAHGTPSDAKTLPRDPDHGPIPVEGPYIAIRQREFPRGRNSRRVAD